jgi:mono/diheme cytochrome c family protein
VNRFAPAGLLAALAVVLLAVPAGADGCRRVAYGGYAQPAYHAPAYDYGHNYYDTVIVPKAIAVAVHPEFYYSVGSEYAQAAFARLIAQELAAIAEAKGRLERPAGPPPVAAPAAVGPIPPAAPDPQPRAAADPNAGPLGIARAMAAESCVRCHKPGSARMDLSDFGRLSRAQLLEVKDRLTTGDPKDAMPQGGKPVADVQLNAVDALLRAAPPK